jgi:hypothetical protein
MHKHTIITAALFMVAYLGLAGEPVVPTIQISPEDVVQTSIQQVRYSSNSLAVTVMWTYTEVGAKKMLAFWESHDRGTIRTVVGDFESIGQIAPRSALPPGVASYSEWREGWLKYRGDKFFGISETDAQKLLVGLKSR